MRFSSLIVKNVLHRPVRTILTTLGLAIAIAAVTILVGISWNFERSFLALYNSKGIDLVVVHAGSSNQLSSSLDEKMADRLRQIEGVADVAPSLVDTVGFEEQNLVSVLVDGWIPGSILFRGIKMLDGRALEPGDDKAVMLGRVLAMTLNKKAGDRLQIAGETFEVVGIFESESWFENGSLLDALEDAPEDDGPRGPGDGVLDPGKSIRRAIHHRIAQAHRVDHSRRRRDPRARPRARRHADPALPGDGLDNGRGRPLPGLGGNAQHDAHVDLRANARDRHLESGGLAAAAGAGAGAGRSARDRLDRDVLGVVLAVVGLRAMTLAPTARGFISPNLPPEVLLIALAMGVGLSLLGGLYPAARAAALEPTEALRYE